MKKIEFIAKYEERLAIAKITWNENTEYAVCSNPNYEQKCWDFSYGYYYDLTEAYIKFGEKLPNGR